MSFDMLVKLLLRAPRKTPIYPSLLEKERDEAKKKQFLKMSLS